MTVAVLRSWYTEDGISGTRLYVWCPGCDEIHAPEIEMPGYHEWDGNFDAPTVSPSILVTYGGNDRRCHSFLEGGQWRFLSDCTHGLSGRRNVAMVNLPHWYVDV